MRGSIRARTTCDRCGGKWRDEYARGRQVAVVCSDCGVSAPAVYVDAPLYEGTRHSLAVRIRREKEKTVGDAVAEALNNTAVVAMRNYAPNERGRKG